MRMRKWVPLYIHHSISKRTKTEKRPPTHLLQFDKLKITTQNLAITVHCYRRTTERNGGGERDSVCHHIKGMFKGNVKWMMRKRNQRPPKNLSLSLDISSFSFSRLFLFERRALTFPVRWQICFSLRSPPLFSLSFCLLLFPLTLTACLSLSLSFLTPSWWKIKDEFKGRRKVSAREKTIQKFQQDSKSQHWWLKHYN